MVDHVLRLKLSLLGSAFRPGTTLFRTIPVILLSVAVVASVIALALAADPERADHRAASVVIAAALSVGIAMAPLSAGLGSALEPRYFAAFPVEPRRLAVALGAAAAVGLPGVLAAALGIGLELTWAGTAMSGVAIMAGVLAAIAIILVSQYVVTLAALLVVSAAARRLITVFARLVVGLSIVVAALAVMLVVDGGASDALIEIAQVVAVTPLGWLWAAPGSELLVLLGQLFAGLAVVAGLVVCWGWLVARVLETPQRIRSAPTTTRLGWFDLVPATPAGVIAARSLLYWVQDPRYRSVLIALPLAPVLMMMALALAGSPLPPLWLLPLPVLALFIGWFTHNDAAYDHTAIWVHVAAPLSGVADRWGRSVPPLVLGLVLLPPGPLFAVWSGVEGVLPALTGVTIGVLLTGLGVSSVASAVGAYPVARPDAGLFDQPPSVGARAGWTPALALLTTLFLMMPALLTAAWGFVEPTWFVVSGVVAVATGVGVFLVGIIVGGRAFGQRAPELLDLALRH